MDAKMQSLNAAKPPASPLTVYRNEGPASFFVPVSLARHLFYGAVFLLVMNLGGIVFRLVLQQDGVLVNALVYFFDASAEANIPTLFSTLILFFAAVLLLVIYQTAGSQAGTGYRKYWLTLSFVFLFLMADEAATIHEQFNKFGGLTGDAAGYLHYFWIVPYAVFALIAGFFFLRFLLRLPARTSRLFIASGSLYIVAALGFEIPEGRLTVLYGPVNLYDKLFCAAEEFLEMSAVILFIHALLRYLDAAGVRLGASKQQAPKNG